MAIKDWAITEGGNNTTLGITLTEGATPYANLNDACRQIMADVRLEVASFGTSVAAASSPDIAIDGQAHTVTGVTPISSFSTAAAGLLRVLYFETATPVANSSRLELPGATNWTTAKGDVAGFRSFGSGNWKLEWRTKNVVVESAGKHMIPVTASAMRPQAAGGPASADVTATDVRYYVLDFDQTTAEYVHFDIPMPSSWDEGTITFVPLWTAAGGTPGQGVVFSLNAVARSNDDAIAYTFTTSVTSTDVLLATGDHHRGPESAALTVEGSPAANDMVSFRLSRVPTDGSDTLAADARLRGIELYITTSAAVDVA